MKTPEYYIRNSIKLSEDCKKWCESNFNIIHYKKYGELIKSTNRISTNIKTVRYQKNNSNEEINRYLNVLICNNKKVEKQLYYVTRKIINHKEIFDYHLLNLIIFQNNKVIKAHHYKNEYNGYRESNYGYGCVSIGMPAPVLIYMSKKFFDKLFDRKDTHKYKINPYDELEYTAYKQFEKVCKYRGFLQIATKYNLNHLLSDFISCRTDFKKININYLKQHWRIIAKNDFGFSELITIKTLEKKGITSFDFNVLKHISGDEIKSIPQNVNTERLLNYLVKHKCDYSYYLDYYSMMKEIGARPETDQTLYPKNIIKAHDKAVKTMNALKKEIKSKELLKITEELSRFEYAGEEYTVVAPKSLNDIVEEGKRLDHCVGSSRYLEAHQKRKFAIMFCRLKSDIKTPLITFTFYYDLTITAIHGYKNKSNNIHLNKVEDFLENEWLPYVRKMKKGAINGRKKNESEYYNSAEC